LVAGRLAAPGCTSSQVPQAGIRDPSNGQTRSVLLFEELCSEEDGV
jgi:hypothetical protein